MAASQPVDGPRVTRWFVRLMIVTAGVQFIVYAVRPMLSYKAIAAGAGAAELGLVTASFSVLSLFAAMPLGRAIDRWGERPFIVIGALLLTSVVAGLYFGNALVLLGVCSAGLGLGHLGTIVGAQTLIAKGAEAGRRDIRFATFTTLNASGQLVGPMVTGLIIGDVAITATASSARGHTNVPHAGIVVAVGGAVGLVVIASALSLLLRPGALANRPSPVRMPTKATLVAVMRVPSMPTAMLSSLTVLSSLDLLTAYLPAYGEAHDIPVRTIGFLLAFMQAAGLVSRLLMLRMIAMFTRRRLLAASMVLAAVGVGLIPFIDSVWLLYLDMLLVGSGLGLGQPITLGWVAGQAPHEIRGTAMSVRLSGNRLGQTVVPTIVGSLAGATGLLAAFIAPSLFLFVAGTFVIRAGTANEDVLD